MKNLNDEHIKVGDKVVLLDFRSEDWNRIDDFPGNFFWVENFDDKIGHEWQVSQVEKDGIYCLNVSGGFNFYWVRKVVEVKLGDYVPEEMFDI